MTEGDKPIDLRRRADSRLLVSRIAADRFWRDGVAATRGEDIAAEAGIATRTLWRYFRSKEACVEPVLAEAGRRFTAVITTWPLDMSIEDFLRSAALPGEVDYSPDEIAAMRVVTLGFREPALRSSWLMVCDAAERESAVLFAQRLGQPAESAEVRRITAAVSGAIRALSDSMSVDYVENGTVPRSADVLGALGAAIREASSGRLGPAAVRD